MFEDQFDVARTTAKKDIVNRLKDMLWIRPEYYSNEVDRLEEKLRKGLNPATDEWLEMFVKVVEKEKGDSVICGEQYTE
jgi:hypothetical protein